MNNMNDKENLKRMFQSVTDEISGETAGSPAVILAILLDSIKDRCRNVPEKVKRRWKIGYTGAESSMNNRCCRKVVLLSPINGMMNIVNADVSWIVGEDGKLHDCQMNVKNIEQERLHRHLCQMPKNSLRA